MARVACYWETDDVLGFNEALNERQAEAVLLLACVSEHNAETGVNWETLEYWANEVLSDADLVESVHENYGYRIENDLQQAIERNRRKLWMTKQPTTQS